MFFKNIRAGIVEIDLRLIRRLVGKNKQERRGKRLSNNSKGKRPKRVYFRANVEKAKKKNGFLGSIKFILKLILYQKTTEIIKILC